MVIHLMNWWTCILCIAILFVMVAGPFNPIRKLSQIDSSRTIHLLQLVWNTEACYCGLGKTSMQTADLEKQVLDHIEGDPNVSRRKLGRELNVSHISI